MPVERKKLRRWSQLINTGSRAWSQRDTRRSGVALSPQVVDLVIFAHTVNDDASDVDPERF
jgi:hypothetical protein